MALIFIVFTSAGAIATLFIVTKLIGNKQMSQLSMFDYITGITIGSIAAEMATNLEEFEKPLTAMLVCGLLSVLMSVLNYKSMRLRRLLTGKSLVLFENGKMLKGNLKKARIDLNEFLTLCRNNGYFDLSQLQTAILEPNGKISFLPLSIYRPANPQDFGLVPPEDKPLINVVIDGHIMRDNLKHTGNDEIWLLKELRKQDFNGVGDVFLATCDCRNKLTAYVAIEKKMTRDPFE